MTKRPATRCYLVSFADGSRIRLYAKSEREVLYVVQNPSDVTGIEVLKRLGYEGKGLS